MSLPINHHTVKPEVHLTPEIKATELVKPNVEGRMSSHKIWIPPNIDYPPHQHPSPHIIIVLEGGGWMKYEWQGEEIRSLIGAGDVFHMPENTPHQVGADSRGMVMIAVGVDSKPLTDPDRMKVLPA